MIINPDKCQLSFGNIVGLIKITIQKSFKDSFIILYIILSCVINSSNWISVLVENAKTTLLMEEVACIGSCGLCMGRLTLCNHCWSCNELEVATDVFLMYLHPSVTDYWKRKKNYLVLEMAIMAKIYLTMILYIAFLRLVHLLLNSNF